MHNSTFTVARDNRYFEDYAVGSIYEFGTIAVTEAEVIDFARRYDPQPFHTDPEAAKDTPFGGLISSGWLTAGLMMRLLVDNYVSSVASLGSPGVKELKWLKPVRPGDELSIRVTIQEARRSRSKPDRGMVGISVDVLNQKKEVVMTMQSVGMILCRKTA
ncbi:MaoC family dehydratase [Geobacter argillaceus]|uniref:Acyl dehydratase n=1 Tax=Geobacter argillaceus TaxID=345631 RepID=A0A562WST7_9BACT|nr:MaoC family dehydratase [Geobacter argillaceus]TWJ32504.1 acyl dehydratase [Geobacter argillaceus]